MSSRLLSCRYRFFRTRLFRQYASYCCFHNSGPNCWFPCADQKCLKCFSNDLALEKHFRNIHTLFGKGASSHQIDVNQNSFQCNLANCLEVCGDMSDLHSAFKSTCRDETYICPFQGCEKQFQGISESIFKSHVS